MNHIHNQLNKVLFLSSERKKALQTIVNTKYRKFGRIQVELTAEQSAAMINAVKAKYDYQISCIYDTINKELTIMGLPTLNNPYKNGKDEKNEI